MRAELLARLEIEATDAHSTLPALVRRLIWLDDVAWSTPDSDGIPVIGGHSDPTGQTALTSLDRRRHLDHALRLILDACAALRGAQTALDRVQGTIAGYDGSQQAADQALAGSMRGRCTNCQQHAATRKGLCQACNMWQRRHGTDRPADRHTTKPVTAGQLDKRIT